MIFDTHPFAALALVFGAAGLWLFIVQLRWLTRAMDSSEWRPVEGIILHSRTWSDADPRTIRTGHLPDIRYRYVVDGHEYTGHFTTFRGLEATARWAGRWAARFDPGDAVTVYYDPADPARAALEPGAGVTSFLRLGAPLLVLGIAALLWTA